MLLAAIDSNRPRTARKACTNSEQAVSRRVVLSRNSVRVSPWHERCTCDPRLAAMVARSRSRGQSLGRWWTACRGAKQSSPNWGVKSLMGERKRGMSLVAALGDAWKVESRVGDASTEGKGKGVEVAPAASMQR